MKNSVSHSIFFGECKIKMNLRHLWVLVLLMCFGSWLGEMNLCYGNEKEKGHRDVKRTKSLDDLYQSDCKNNGDLASENNDSQAELDSLVERVFGGEATFAMGLMVFKIPRIFMTFVHMGVYDIESINGKPVDLSMIPPGSRFEVLLTEAYKEESRQIKFQISSLGDSQKLKPELLKVIEEESRLKTFEIKVRGKNHSYIVTLDSYNEYLLNVVNSIKNYWTAPRLGVLIEALIEKEKYELISNIAEVLPEFYEMGLSMKSRSLLLGALHGDRLGEDVLLSFMSYMNKRPEELNDFLQGDESNWDELGEQFKIVLSQFLVREDHFPYNKNELEQLRQYLQFNIEEGALPIFSEELLLRLCESWSNYFKKYQIPPVLKSGR